MVGEADNAYPGKHLISLENEWICQRLPPAQTSHSEATQLKECDP
jgi:hypothetical protein